MTTLRVIINAGRIFHPAILFTLILCAGLPHLSNAQDYTEQAPYLTELNAGELATWLQNAPHEHSPQAKTKAILIDLPLPGGEFISVRCAQSPIIDQPDLFPGIRTYSVQGLDDPTITGRLMLSPRGVDATLLTKNGDVNIRPAAFGDTEHHVYFIEHGKIPHEKDDRRFHDGYIHTHQKGDSAHWHPGDDPAYKLMAAYNIGTQLRQYRMHVIADGEYSIAVDGPNPTTPNVFAAITAAVNSMNAFYVRDMSMTLLLNANSTIYLDPATDPFATPGNDDPDWAGESLDHHQTLANNNSVPLNTYDVGHLFSGRVSAGSGGGGIAFLSVVCDDTNITSGPFSGPAKAGGGSGVPDPQGGGWVDLLAHEFTHQFSADHTFSGTAGNCTPDQFGPNSAYEPGSGSTIVSYSGICNNHDVPNPGNISYYHTRSIEEVNNYINTTGNCNTNAATGNDVPVVSGQTTGCTPNYNIPIRTPFEITGSATDNQQGSLTYTWEQFNLGTQHDPITAPTTTNQPLFRSFFPSPSATRTFPQINTILSGNYNGDAQTAAALGLGNWQGELLPEVARTINLRLTVRDNNAAGGGVENTDVAINVVNTGPFAVTSPNGGETRQVNVPFNVTWTVAGTTAAPISCANVTIRLSTDGGLTFPTNLGSFPNNGTASVTIPSGTAASTTARIRVECGVDCFRFFDISNADFTIQASPGGPPVVNEPTVTQPGCTVPTGTIVVNATGSGTLEYSVDNGSTWQLSSTFSGLNPGNYNIKVRLQAEPTSMTAYANNPVVINMAPSPPVVNAPTVTQPTCATPGTIVVNATGNGTLEYSIDNGANWQTSATFSGLAPGNYNIVVRLQSDPTCTTAYASNPVVLNAPTGCCTTYTSTDVPKTISENGTPTVTSTLNIPTSGTITDVNLVNLDVNHTWISDLRITIQSPASTQRIMWDQACDDEDNILLTFDDESAIGYGAIPCPPNGGTYQPNQTLAAFDGENQSGTWTLTIEDLEDLEGGSLQGWGLQVCSTPVCTPPVVTAPTVTQPTCATPGTIVVNATGNGTLEYSVNNGTNWQTSATFSGLAAGDYNIVVRLQSDPTCMTTYTGNPVTLNAPTGCCPTTLAVDDTPIASGTYKASNLITSTGSVPNMGNVVFDTGNSVELNGNFEVLLGGVFEILLVGCTP